MPDPTTKEKAPENNKAKQTAYLVCEGALCQCDAGVAPVKLKVTSHKKAYINNNKLLATEKDITFDAQGHFGTCSFKSPGNNACVPAVQQWLKPYKDIEVENQKVLTDQSQLICTTGGKITIKMHGQQQTVNAGQAQNMDRSIATQVNPLADLAPIPEADKKVTVKSITGKSVDDPKYKTVGSQKANAVKSSKDSDKDKDPADIYVRPGQEVEFTATYAGTESLVCWKLKGKGEPIYFLQHGPKYKTSFPEPGKYTIEGYGTGADSHLDVDTQINTKNERVKRAEYTECMLDILVQDNKLTGVSHVQSDSILDKYDNKKFVEAQIRIGVPATFEPVYLMAPVQEEVDHLILLIRDASGNEIQRCKGKANIIFEARNAAAAYTVEAYFDNSEADPFTYAFRTMQNTVSIIAASALKNENEKIRLGTHIQFTVSKFQFTDDTVSSELIEAEHAQIKWYENSEMPAAIGLSYAKTYQREDNYTVVCKVTEGKPGWFATKKNGQDDFHFNVTKNYPTAIEQKTAGKAKIGKQISFELKGIFAIDHSDLTTVKWQLTGTETKSTSCSQTFLFVPAKKGTYTLAATMNGKTISIPFECIACEIVKGWWTDSDGNILTGNEEEPSNTIGFAGWEQEVVASFKHIGLNGEDVTIEVWDKDIASSTSLFKKDIKVSDSYTVDTCVIKLDQQIRDKVKEKGVTSEGSLYFTVKAKNGLKVINDGMSLPDGGNYLNVDSKVRIKTYFADNNDTKRYSTGALDTPVYIQVKSTNLIGEELEMETWDYGYLYDSKLGDRISFKVDKYGMASVKLNMDAIKPKLLNVNDSIRVYTKIYNKKTKEEYDPRNGKYKLTLYKTLATSASSIGTTKAFVVVDASKGEKKEEESEPNEGCGLLYRNEIQCTKYGTQYGPVYWGTIKIENYAKWSVLISEGKLTEEEKSILVAMSENEGNLDAVQSYDSEIVTVGAMQKTMNPQGYGEFPIQMWEFKQEYPDRFTTLFLNCGWDVKKEEEKGKAIKYRAYYQNNTGSELKNTIRQGFEESNFKNKVQCIPIEPLINAAKDICFQSKQIEDFIDRLKNKVLVIIPDGYKYKLSDYLKSKLGKATALDHHINRPAHLSSYFGASLGRFFELNPAVSKNPNEWGINHNEYEKIIIEDYGITRSGTDMVNRYKKMKDKL